MAEYEDYDVGSPGPRANQTLDDLQRRVHYLVENLYQVRGLMTDCTSGMRNTVNRLEDVACDTRVVNHQITEIRRNREKQRTRLNRELDPQTETALSRFLTENLRQSTIYDDFTLCSKIRKTYPKVTSQKSPSTEMGFVSEM